MHKEDQRLFDRPQFSTRSCPAGGRKESECLMFTLKVHIRTANLVSKLNKILDNNSQFKLSTPKNELSFLIRAESELISDLIRYSI